MSKQAERAAVDLASAKMSEVALNERGYSKDTPMHLLACLYCGSVIAATLEDVHTPICPGAEARWTAGRKALPPE